LKLQNKHNVSNVIATVLLAKIILSNVFNAIVIKEDMDQV
jgi:hypothetical protein